MHRDGDVTDGIMLRDGGSRNAVSRLFYFPVRFIGISLPLHLPYFKQFLLIPNTINE